MYNLETARGGVTIDTLEAVASVFQVDALTLLTVAATLDRCQSLERLLQHLAEQGNELDALGVRRKWPNEFQDSLIAAMQQCSNAAIQANR